MGFIKLGQRRRIMCVASTVDALRLSHTERDSLAEKLAELEYVNLNPEKFIYTRERAVSAFERYGLNGNADGFVDGVLKRRYATFINVPRHIDHANADPIKSTGIVLDAVYHPLTHPKGGWVETISARDKSKMAQVRLPHILGNPTLLDAVLSGMVTDVSMGCYVGYSVCTVCGNRAHDVMDYCNHVIAHRGKRIKAAAGCPVPIQDGYVIAGELNYDVTFFELSDITTTVHIGGGGADADAKILEKIAKTNAGIKCTGWECFVINRIPAEMSKLSHKASENSVSSGRRNNPRLNKSEAEMKGKKAQEVAPVADDEKQSVTDRVDAATDPADEDKKLHDQGLGKSETDPAQVIVDPDKITQEDKSEDYPLKGAAQEADPANRLGEKPEPVKEGEDEVREEKFDAIKPELGDKAPDIERNMKDDMKKEDEEIEGVGELSKSLGALIKKHFPKIAKSESFKEILDNLDDLQVKRNGIEAAMRRTRSAKRKRTLGKQLKKVNAEISKYFDQYGGNPQELEDNVSGESETEDKKLHDQGKGTSDTNEETAVLDEEDITQEPESPDYPQNGKVIEAADADHVIEEVFKNIKERPDISPEQHLADAYERYGIEIDPMQLEKIRSANKELPEEFKENIGDFKIEPGSNEPEKVENGEEKVENGEGKELPEKVKESRRKRAGEGKVENDEEKIENGEEKKEEPVDKKANEAESAPEPDQADGASDISNPVGDAEEEIGKGNLTTLVSPATEKVAPPGELIQAGIKLSPERASLRRRVLGQSEDVESRMSQGTAATKASDETSQIAEQGKKEMEDKLKIETKGESAPVPIVGSLDLAMKVIKRFAKNDRFLREVNERLFKRVEGMSRYYKWDVVKKIAAEMLRKGMFLADGKGEQRNIPEQKKAAIRYARDMMRMTNDWIEDKKVTVAMVPEVARRAGKQWVRTVELPRDGSVKTAVAQRAAVDPDVAELGGKGLFDD